MKYDGNYKIVGVDAYDPSYKGIYRLDLDKYLIDINDMPFGSYKRIDPKTYYLTSGDAVRKTRQLLHDVKGYRQYLIENNNIDNIWTIDRLIQSIIKLLDDLMIVRGKSIFLETEWNEGTLLVMPKNPRNV